MLLQPGVLSLAWGSVVRQLAAGLGVELDEVTETYVREPAPEDFDIASGHIEKGTAAALRFEVQGMKDGKVAVVLEHVTRLRDDLRPDWPQPAQEGGSYRLEITGEPSYAFDLCLSSPNGDHNHAGLVATAARVVNAIPAVVAAPPGIRTTLDLPLITGKGLYAVHVSRGTHQLKGAPMRNSPRYFAPLFVAAGAAAAILAAPAAGAQPPPRPRTRAHTGAAARTASGAGVGPQCVNTGGSEAMGGSATECATPGNVEINDTPAAGVCRPLGRHVRRRRRLLLPLIGVTSRPRRHHCESFAVSQHFSQVSAYARHWLRRRRAPRPDPPCPSAPAPVV